MTLRAGWPGLTLRNTLPFSLHFMTPWSVLCLHRASTTLNTTSHAYFLPTSWHVHRLIPSISLLPAFTSSPGFNSAHRFDTRLSSSRTLQSTVSSSFYESESCPSNFDGSLQHQHGVHSLCPTAVNITKGVQAGQHLVIHIGHGLQPEHRVREGQGAVRDRGR